jgi:hypothetical protein
MTKPITTHSRRLFTSHSAAAPEGCSLFRELQPLLRPLSCVAQFLLPPLMRVISGSISRARRHRDSSRAALSANASISSAVSPSAVFVGRDRLVRRRAVFADQILLGLGSYGAGVAEVEVAAVGRDQISGAGGATRRELRYFQCL